MIKEGTPFHFITSKGDVLSIASFSNDTTVWKENIKSWPDTFIFLPDNSRYYYNMHITINKGIEDCAEIKRLCNQIKHNGRDLVRLVVHLHYLDEEGPTYRFTCKQKQYIFLHSPKTFLLKSNHSYVMEMNLEYEITNIIYDSTTATMRSRPTWYIPWFDK